MKVIITNVSKAPQTLQTDAGPVPIKPGDAVALDLSRARVDEVRKQPGHFSVADDVPPAPHVPLPKSRKGF